MRYRKKKGKNYYADNAVTRSSVKLGKVAGKFMDKMTKKRK